ncbi:uncharacterized protein NPIL_664981 [Nephila pilipes]|uniref:BED-type domain-containing protein n=1 Tax=Nephila pilipes TaxID=299642 RepID=A0A8X6UE21_NEPPI|nr:uncharacterized protein NPIL_664981 [Nephila pilipes]
MMSIQISSIKSEISDSTYNDMQTDNDMSVTNVVQKGRSSLWNFFTKWDNNFAICNFCQNKLSYKTSTANLKKHLDRKHDTMACKLSPSFPAEERIVKKDGIYDQKLNNKIVIQDSFEIIDSNFDSLRPKKKKKLAHFQNLFDVLEGSIARCKICSDKLSFKSSTSNMIEHYKNKHPTICTNPEESLDILEQENLSEEDKLSSSNEDSSEIQESTMDYQEIDLNPKIHMEKILTTSNLHSVEEHLRKERVEQSKAFDKKNDLNFVDEHAQNGSKSSESSQNPSAIYLKKTSLDGRKKKWSWIWNYFTEVDKNFALCNICNQVFNYKTTISNLAKHKKRMHPDVTPCLNQKRTQGSEKNESVNKEESMKVGLIDRMLPNIDEIKNGKKSIRERSSYVWRFFKRINDTLAECNFCKIKLSYKNSVTSLMIHRKREHPAIYLKSNSPTTSENIQKGMDGFSVNEDLSEDDLNDEKSTETVAKKKGGRKKSSSAWDFFTLLDKHFAQCRICEKKFSVKSTVSNLVRHIRRKHSPPTVVQETVRNGLDVVSVNVDCSLRGQIRDQSKITDSEDEESPIETVAVPRRKNPRRTSVVWDFFTFIDKNYAQCKICKVIFSHRTTLSNLRKHYQRKHHIEALIRNSENQMETEKNEFDNTSINEDYLLPPTLDQPKISESDGEESEIEGIVNKRNQVIGKHAPSWEFFNFIDNNKVQCKVCGLIFSRQTTLLNLHQHFEKEHPDFTAEFNPEAKQLPIKITKTFPSFNQSQALNTWDEQPVYVLPNINGVESEDMSMSFLSSQKSQNNNESHMANISQTNSQNRTTDSLLNERLVKAVEESNQLLKNMQKTMEKQAEISNKLLNFLEGMKYTK